MSKYIELYPDSPLGSGLIFELSAIQTIPWFSLSESEKQSLEVAYFNRYGSKPISSQFSIIHTTRRAPFLAAFYGEKWKRLWQDFKEEYSAINPYTITEQGSDSRERVHDATTDFGRVVDEIGTDTGTVDNTGNDTTSTESGIFGFNSIESVPSDTGASEGTSQATETRDLSATRKTTNSGQDTVNREESENGEYATTKTGNIGYRSPSELIREDILTWATPYFEIVFADIDSAIALKIYN